MKLKFYNTLSKQIIAFDPPDYNKKYVGLYCCGPTVHNYTHIGNFRTFVLTDIIRRTLEFNGYNIKHVMNITDVDDKIINAVNSLKETNLNKYTSYYTDAFFYDLKQLNCLAPHNTPKVTEYIPNIIKLIKKLINNNIAYKTNDGSIYFNINKYISLGGKYGWLTNVNFNKYNKTNNIKYKNNINDFVLWKSYIADDKNIYWDSPWGKGRPGWHIECSAISQSILGKSFDIHLGGEDLIFPHHENEIAQCAASSFLENKNNKHIQPFAHYWIRETNKLISDNKISSVDAAQIIYDWNKINSVFGIEMKNNDYTIPHEIQLLFNKRNDARKLKDFATSDNIRNKLKLMGWIIEDTQTNSVLKRTIS